MEFIIYSKDNCMQCEFTKRSLMGVHASYEERNINDDESYLKYLELKGVKSLPHVEVYREGVRVDEFSGFQPSKIREWTN